MGAAKMKPRDSIPTTASIFLLPIFAKSPSIAAANASPSLSSVVMSLNRIPGFGKSGTSRMRAPRSAVCTGTAHRLASRPSEARPTHALLPAGLLRTYRAERRRLLVRDEPDRPADPPVQGSTLLWGHRSDDRRGQTPRGHGPRWHRHRGPVAFDTERVLRRGKAAGRSRATRERRVRRARGETPRAVPRLRVDPDGRSRRGPAGAPPCDRRAAHAGRRRPFEHPRPRARRPRVPALLRRSRPPEGLRLRSSDDPGRRGDVHRVRTRPDRGLSVRHDARDREALLRGRVQTAPEYPVARRARRRRDPVPHGAHGFRLARFR